jgi:uncharacterized repeat protein (TIGR01451 family)
MNPHRARLLCVAAAVFGLIVLAPGGGGANQPSGTITNSAAITYEDQAHRNYAAESNVITTTIAQVGALTVTPKEAAVALADNFPVGGSVLRTFTVVNTSNLTDAYTVASASAGAGRVTAVAFAYADGPVPVTLGSTISRSIAPGASLTVTVSVDSTGVAIGTSFPVDIVVRTTAGGTANGLQSDTGRTWAQAASAPTVAGPTGAASTVSKTVGDGRFQAAAPGAALNYKISFTNYGGSPAHNVVVVDVFPPGLTPNLGTMTLNGSPLTVVATLVGQTLSIPVGTMLPGAQILVSIDSIVSSAATNGQSLVNIANITSSEGGSAATTPTSVLVGIADVVYDGVAGAQHPVAGAVVSLIDPTTHQPLKLSTVAAAPPPNTQNANPFVTGADGRYNFQISINGVGSSPSSSSRSTAGGSRRVLDVSASAVPLNFDMVLTAPNYVPREIGIQLSPDSTGLLYSASLTSIDGQPLAKPGSFSLASGNVVLSNVFDVLGNVPLFQARPVHVVKTVNKTSAQPGDLLTYTVSYSNITTVSLTAPTLVDQLPPGLVFLPGSAQLDGTAITPTINGPYVIFPLAALEPGVTHAVVYRSVVLPGTPAETVLTNQASVSGTYGGQTITGSGSIGVRIVGGLFTTRAVITGRVYADIARVGRFVAGDRGVPNVRIYLESGESSLTDANGRYSFQGVRPGMHIIRIDPLTVPIGLHTYGDTNLDGERGSQRLVHGLLDEGLLQDVNFALEVTP